MLLEDMCRLQASEKRHWSICSWGPCWHENKLLLYTWRAICVSFVGRVDKLRTNKSKNGIVAEERYHLGRTPRYILRVGSQRSYATRIPRDMLWGVVTRMYRDWTRKCDECAGLGVALGEECDRLRCRTLSRQVDVAAALVLLRFYLMYLYMALHWITSECVGYIDWTGVFEVLFCCVYIKATVTLKQVDGTLILTSFWPKGMPVWHA